MDVIIAFGSNLGDRGWYLKTAREEVEKILGVGKYSDIIESLPVDYLEQPSFLNQVGQYHPTKLMPTELLFFLQAIEIKMGRNKIVPKGPRCIDLDIIFIGDLVYSDPLLEIPHPQWKNRSFVFDLIKQLPYWKKIGERYDQLQSI